jgi:hypothetical protein
MKNILLVCVLISNFILAQTQTIFDINNISLPLDNKGNLGYIYLPPSVHGTFDNIQFIFSGGFWFSGYNGDTLWANGMASASLIENYIPGNVDSNQYDPRYDIYLASNSGYIDYAEWNRYKFAVANGAEYYDGDENGYYDPVDLNGNNRWDPEEDKPDVFGVGTQTAWCVFNDGVENRIRFSETLPLGIEIHQSVFGFSPYIAPQIQNVIFIRYKIINTGKVNSLLDSVYFTAWADADLGIDFEDDLVGSDTLLNSGFVYNEMETDPGFGIENPSFFITLLQGPHSYIPGETFLDNNSNNIYDAGIDTPIDTAYNRKGSELGIESFPGAKNLKMTSFTNTVSSDPVYGDPHDEYEARNYMTGKLPNGQMYDPCAITPYGGVVGGIDCNLVNPLYWFSGDPINNIGWLNTVGSDKRVVINSGPFNLEVGKPITIIYAYIIGRGTDRLNSITKAREIAEFTHQFYQSNFDDNLVSVEEEIANIPSEFILYQNYPNPFNPSTTISWQSPVSGHQTLKVYDVLGNEVATLVNQEQSVGSYRVDFDASHLSSGVYFYQLKAGSFIQTKKMISLK